MSKQYATQYARRERARQALAVVGVDAGKFQHAMVVRVRGRPDGRPLLFPTTRAGFEQAVAAIRQAITREHPAGAPRGEVLVGIEFAGAYGFTFAHYLHGLGEVDGVRFGLVSVLAIHTKRWKEVAHRQPLKTDRKDAVGICDLAAQGHYVGFPFLARPYTELRYLLSARERLVTLRRGTITRLRTALDVVFPEFQAIFFSPAKPTARAVLAAFPGPDALLAAKPLHVRRVLKAASRNHAVKETYAKLIEAARQTVALPTAQGAQATEVTMLIERIELFDRQLRVIEAAMRAQLDTLPAAQALLTIPNVAPVTAAVFLGSLGDPRAYASSREVLALAGLTLVEASSGIRQGEQRISKRGRPVLRKHAHMFAIRSVQQGGIFRAAYEALLARNGRKAIPALTAMSRRGLRLFFAVARSATPWRGCGAAAAQPQPSQSPSDRPDGPRVLARRNGRGRLEADPHGGPPGDSQPTTSSTHRGAKRRTRRP